MSDPDASGPVASLTSPGPVQTLPPASPGAAAGLSDALFVRLVESEDDVVGLLAYSLAMQDRREWVEAFRGEIGRDPDGAEAAAYAVGECIGRRLVTYRKRAEATLSGGTWALSAPTPVGKVAGDAGEAQGAPSMPSKISPRGTSRLRTSRLMPPASSRADPVAARNKIVGGLVLFVVLVVAVILARRMVGI